VVHLETTRIRPARPHERTARPDCAPSSCCPALASLSADPADNGPRTTAGAEGRRSTPTSAWATLDPMGSAVARALCAAVEVLPADASADLIPLAPLFV